MTVSVRAREPEQKADRRRAILDAAFRLWHESTYEQFTMAELAQRLGIAKGTLYLSFETKEDLFRCLLESMVTGWANEMSTWLAALRSPARPRQIADVIGRSLQSRPHMLRLMAIAETLPSGQEATADHSRDSRPWDPFENAVRALHQVLPPLGPGFGERFWQTLRALLIGYFARLGQPEPARPVLVNASPAAPMSPVDQEFLLTVEALLEGYLKLSRTASASNKGRIKAKPPSG